MESMEFSEACTFFASDMMSGAFQSFEDMKKAKELCDVTIKVQSYSFVAHRLVLAATIPYFKLMFSTKMLEANQAEITLLDLEPKAVELILDFAYSGKICLTTENVFSLLLASDYFHLNKVKQYCGQFLSFQLNNSNVAQIHDFAMQINHVELIESTDCYIQDNFEEFAKTSELTNMPYSYLQKLISKDSLNVSGENIIFEAIMKWTKSSPCERLESLPKLLSEVRMPFLSRDYLNKLLADEELIQKSYHCRFIVSAAIKYISSPGENSIFLPFRTLRREYSILKHGIYVMFPRVYCLSHYDPDGSTWDEFATLITPEEPIWHIGSTWDEFVTPEPIWQIVFVKEEIFVFLKNHRYFICNLRSTKWKKSLPILNGYKFSHSAIIPHHNKIYCFGGMSSSPSKIFCFCTIQKDWTFPGQMTTARSFPAGASLGASIYVTGGLHNSATHRSVERLCVLTSDVTELSPMLYRRQSHSCASVDSKIYVSGGYCDEVLISAEVYDPLIDKWTSIAPMMKPSMNCSFVSYQKKLYLFRCHLPVGPSDVQIYDAERNEWILDKAPGIVASAVAVPGN